MAQEVKTPVGTKIPKDKDLKTGKELPASNKAKPSTGTKKEKTPAIKSLSELPSPIPLFEALNNGTYTNLEFILTPEDLERFKAAAETAATAITTGNDNLTADDAEQVRDVISMILVDTILGDTLAEVLKQSISKGSFKDKVKKDWLQFLGIAAMTEWWKKDKKEYDISELPEGFEAGTIYDCSMDVNFDLQEDELPGAGSAMAAAHQQIVYDELVEELMAADLPEEDYDAVMGAYLNKANRLKGKEPGRKLTVAEKVTCTACMRKVFDKLMAAKVKEAA